jgi:hypothetical protein
MGASEHPSMAISYKGAIRSTGSAKRIKRLEIGL